MDLSRLENRPALILGLALLAFPAMAAEDPVSAIGSTPVPTDPVFQVLLIDGSTLTGQLVQLGPDDQLSLAVEEGKSQSIPLDRVVSLTRRGNAPPALPGGSLIQFPEGDRLRAIIGSVEGADLVSRPAALDDVDLKVPVDSVLGLLLSPPDETDALESLLRKLRSEPRPAEVLWLANGDRLAGSFLALGSESVTFQPETGQVEIPRSSVLALGFAPELVQYPRPKGIYLELTFTDGSRLGVTDCRVEQGRVLARTRFGAEIKPSLSSLSRVHVRSDAIQFLSDRPAAASRYVGYLGHHPETYGRDATWDGHPLSLAGQPYDRGLGMLPRTLLAYPLDGREKRFQALVGLDDHAGPKASVVFRVLVDGQEERFVSPPMTRRDAPLPVDVELKGAKLLILVVEFGQFGDVQDSADWVEARLIR